MIACITDTQILFWANFAAFSVLLYQSEIVRNAKYVVSDRLYRLSDYTYIEL